MPWQKEAFPNLKQSSRHCRRPRRRSIEHRTERSLGRYRHRPLNVLVERAIVRATHRLSDCLSGWTVWVRGNHLHGTGRPYVLYPAALIDHYSAHWTVARVRRDLGSGGSRGADGCKAMGSVEECDAERKSEEHHGMI
jgi:hypothetical protein